MIESAWLIYITIFLVVLLLISLYFNIKFLLTLKEHKQNENALIKSAYFNPVTELPNRTNIELVLEGQIDRVLRHDQTFLLSAIKILNYQEVKIHSQELADKFMLEASNRLLSCIRNEDIVGHILNDTFIIIFNEYLNEKNYDIVLNRIQTAFLKNPDLHTKHQISYNIKIGQITYPQSGTEAKLLINKTIQSTLK